MKLIQSVKRRMASDVRPPVTSGSNSTSQNDSQNSQQPLSPTSRSSPLSAARQKSLEDTNPFQTLMSLKDAPVSDRPELFKKKLVACATIYDFNQNTQMKEKDLKKQTLSEVVEYINQARNCFTESSMQDLVATVSANIFRSLPPGRQRNPLAIYDPEDDEPTLEPSWPHLQIVYELFLRFTVSNEVDPKVAKKFIDQSFILRLLDLFDSEDPRERD